MGALITRLLTFLGFLPAAQGAGDINSMGVRESRVQSSPPVRKSKIRHIQQQQLDEKDEEGNPKKSRATRSSRPGSAGSYDSFESDSDKEVSVQNIQWVGEAKSVFVTGTWLGWSEKVELFQDDEDRNLWEADVEFRREKGEEIELKFIVDDEWVISNDMPTKTNEVGSLNNIVEFAEKQEREGSAAAEKNKI